MNENLFQAMQVLFMRYAFYFNQKYERRGHLFGCPYGQSVCLHDSYLLAASLYIHVNPVAAGLVEHYSHYRWSSWKIYTRKTSLETFVDPSFILGLFSPNQHEARKRYRRKLEQANELKTRVFLKDKKAVSNFRELLTEKYPGFFRLGTGREKSGSKDISTFASDEELEKIMASLKGRKRITNQSDKKARIFLIEQLIARGFTRQEIADKLGINRKTIYDILLTPQKR